MEDHIEILKGVLEKVLTVESALQYLINKEVSGNSESFAWNMMDINSDLKEALKLILKL